MVLSLLTVVIKHQNGFAHANHPVRTIVGAITTRIDIRIGLFSKESFAGSIISLCARALGLTCQEIRLSLVLDL